MPSFANEADKSAMLAIERWMQMARDEVEDIQGWRSAPLERIWHGGWPSPPNPVQFNTPYVCGWIVSNHPKLDVAPVMEIANAIAAWHTDHNDQRIPERHVLESLLETALTVVSSAMFAIRRRMVDLEPLEQPKVPGEHATPRTRVASRQRDNDADRLLFNNHPDLHALKQWAGGLEHLMEEFAQGTDSPDEHVWIVFRPTAEANTAIIKFSAKYPIPIGQLEEARKWTEEALERFVVAENQDTIDALLNALGILQRRATAAVETIESIELATNRRNQRKAPVDTKIGVQEVWAADDDPPIESKFKAGPLEGTLAQLSEWLDIDQRTLKEHNRRTSWWIKRIHTRKYAAWLTSQTQLNRAIAKQRPNGD